MQISSVCSAKAGFCGISPKAQKIMDNQYNMSKVTERSLQTLLKSPSIQLVALSELTEDPYGDRLVFVDPNGNKLKECSWMCSMDRPSRTALVFHLVAEKARGKDADMSKCDCEAAAKSVKEMFDITI